MPDDRATADAFDLKRLPDAFYDDPYPTYRALGNIRLIAGIASTETSLLLSTHKV